jgi:DNA primase
LFNLHRAAAAAQPTVVVVEGFFDCLKVHQAGTAPVVALMGTVLYPSQQRALLEHFQSVILMLDGDAAGRHATATIAAQLQPHVSVHVIHLPELVQPDQLSTQAFRPIWQAHLAPLTLGQTCSARF